jgi:hypothetical protein
MVVGLWGLYRCLSMAPKWGFWLCRALLAEMLQKKGERATAMAGSMLLPWLGACDYLGANSGKSLR